MRGFRLAALAVLVAVASAPRPHAQGLPFSLFERYLESLREQTGIPGISAVIVQGGRPVWSAGLGRQDVERSIGARDDTVYPIGDLTQTFAAVLVGAVRRPERAQHPPAHPAVDRHDSRRLGHAAQRAVARLQRRARRGLPLRPRAVCGPDQRRGRLRRTSVPARGHRRDLRAPRHARLGAGPRRGRHRQPRPGDVHRQPTRPLRRRLAAAGHAVPRRPRRQSHPGASTGRRT